MLEVPSCKKSFNQNKFEFKVDAKKYAIPTMDHLPVKYTVKLQTLAAESQGGTSGVSAEAAGEFMDVLVSMLDEYAPGVTDKVDMLSLQEILKAWMDAAEASVGE